MIRRPAGRRAAVAAAVVLAAIAALALAAAPSHSPAQPHPPPAFADGETTCRISVSATAHPVLHNGSARRNPDGTLYPGDAVNYLFRYSARLYGAGHGAEPGACDSLRAGPVEARGRYSAPNAMSVSGPSGGFEPSPHPSVHRGVDAAWLRTDHYFRSWWGGYECGTVPYVRVYACERVGLRVADSPSFSVRSDGPMAGSERDAHDRWLRGGPNRGFEVRPTYDLHLAEAASPGGRPPWDAPSAGPALEDAASAAAFAAAVRAACSGLPAGSGCVFGRAEVEPRSIAGEECLSGIVAARMPGLLAPPSGPPSGPLGPGAPTRAQWEANPPLKRAVLSGMAWNASAPVMDMTVDECAAAGAERLALSVSAVHTRHDPSREHAHRTVRAERSAAAPAPISEPRIAVAVERPPILDADGHPSANADGTYYEWDLPSVHVRPHVRFGAERHEALSFLVSRGPAPLPELFTHACSAAPACSVVVGDGGAHIADTAVESSHGDRLDVFRPDAGSVGVHTATYAVELLNIGRPVRGTASVHDVQVRVVPYLPWYSAAFAYTALAGPGHTTLDKMHALALRYEGSLGDGGGDGGGTGEAHPGRRSKVSLASANVSYVLPGPGGTPAPDPAAGSTMSLRSAGGLAGGGAPVSVASRGGPYTAVIGGAGVARLLLAHDPPGPPAWDGGAGGAAPAVGGIALDGLVESAMFGGRSATRLASYEYSYPAAHVSAPLNVTAVQGPGGAGGPARSVGVSAELAPAAGRGAVPLAEFMRGHLEHVAALREAGMPWHDLDSSAGARRGTATADPTASHIEIDGVRHGLALVEPVRGGRDRAEADDAAAREACPRGSAVLYDIDDGTGALFGEPQASVECGGRSLNGALVSGGHARVRTAMCAHSEFALSEWAARACAPAAADAASFRLAGPADPPPRPFPAGEFAAAYAGDMHDASNRAEGRGSAAGTVGIGHVLVAPAADRALGNAAAVAEHRYGGPPAHHALFSIAGRYGEAAALGSPPPYELEVSAGGRTASVAVGPHALSSPVEYVFAAGPSPGGIVLEPRAPSPHVARVRAAEWFGAVSELYVDGDPVGAAGTPGGSGSGWGGPPCRPYCEVRIGGPGGSGMTNITATNAWGGTASLSVSGPRSGGGPYGGAASAADLAYGPAVAYAEASVPYLVVVCVAAACLAAYSRFAAAGAARR